MIRLNLFMIWFLHFLSLLSVICRYYRQNSSSRIIVVLVYTVSTLYFVEGEAITFTQVTSSGTNPVVYIAGKISGIHFSPINSDLEITSPLPLIVD